jgi:hypothetical protein
LPIKPRLCQRGYLCTRRSCCWRNPGARTLKSGCAGCRMASSRAAAARWRWRPFRKTSWSQYQTHGLAQQVAGTGLKLPLIILPPGVDGFRLRPREVFIGLHIDIFSLRVLGRPGCEACRPCALVIQDRGLSLGNNIELWQTIYCLPSIRSATNGVVPQAFHKRAVSAVPPPPARSNQ